MVAIGINRPGVQLPTWTAADATGDRDGSRFGQAPSGFRSSLIRLDGGGVIQPASWHCRDWSPASRLSRQGPSVASRCTFELGLSRASWPSAWRICADRAVIHVKSSPASRSRHRNGLRDLTIDVSLNRHARHRVTVPSNSMRTDFFRSRSRPRLAPLVEHQHWRLQHL
jgi:hypothetical protein